MTMTKCPLCGSRKIKRVSGPVRTPGGNRLTKVTRDECPDCKEQFFDITATDKIQAADKRTPVKAG